MVHTASAFHHINVDWVDMVLLVELCKLAEKGDLPDSLAVIWSYSKTCGVSLQNINILVWGGTSDQFV